MDNMQKELNDRKETIEKEIEEVFTKNIKITDWDIPEVDDRKVAEMLIGIIKNKVVKIGDDIEAGKYDYY